MARLVLAAALLLCAAACSSSKHSATSTATTTGPLKSPIVVKTPVPNSQWRSPLTIKGTTNVSGKLTAEVLNGSGKQLGSADTTPSDGRFSISVAFKAKQLVPGAVLVHDADSEHSVQIPLVLTP